MRWTTLFLIFVSGTVVAQPARKYCNERFGFCLSYPSDRFDRVEQSDNADGLILMSEQDGIRMAISGSNNIMQWTLDDLSELEKETAAEEYGSIEQASLKRGPGLITYRFRAGGKPYLHRIYHRGEEIVFLRLRGSPGSDAKALEVLLSDLVIEFQP